MLKKIPVLFLAFLVGAVSVFAQNAQVRSLTNGQKYKIKGVVVARDDNSFTVRDAVGVDTKVAIAPNTSIKTKGGFFGGGDKIASDQIIRGLNLQVEGRGDSAGMLAATKIRFGDDDLRVAQSIQSRVAPVEDRVTQTEQNAERISGQIDELMAISNAARGGAKAAQDSADAAIAGVNATNHNEEKISGAQGAWHFDGGTAGAISNGATSGLLDATSNAIQGTASNGGSGMSWTTGKFVQDCIGKG